MFCGMIFKIFVVLLLARSSDANEVVCQFDTLPFWDYTCGVLNQTIDAGSELTFNIDAIDEGKISSDVKSVEFAESIIDFVPIEVFKAFPSVEKLVFLGTKFKTWKVDYLKPASNLLALVVSDNLLEKLDDFSFAPSPYLLVLTLYNNKIYDVGKHAFKGLTMLSILQLSGNEISLLDEDIFKDLPALAMLDLFDNKLEILPMGIFNENKQLEALRLDGNKFTVIANGVFDRDSNLKSLNLTNNLIFSIDAAYLPEKLQVLYVGKMS